MLAVTPMQVSGIIQFAQPNRPDVTDPSYKLSTEWQRDRGRPPLTHECLGQIASAGLASTQQRALIST
jgi:hypothetical protein